MRDGLLTEETDILFLTEDFLNNNYQPDPHILLFVQKTVRKVVVRPFRSVKDLNFEPIHKFDKLMFVTPRRFSLRLYYLLWKRMPIWGRGRVTWVESEEGLGSYIRYQEQFTRYFKAKQIRAALKHALNIVPGWFLTKRKLRLLSNSRNKDAVALDRETYRRIAYAALRGYEAGVKTLSSLEPKPIFLFASQPGIEMQWMAEEELPLLLEELKGYAASLGMELKIKPHPAESSFRYSTEILYDLRSIPLEAAISHDNRIKSIGSICSTALYTAKLVSSVETIMISTPNLEISIGLNVNVRTLRGLVDRSILLCQN